MKSILKLTLLLVSTVIVSCGGKKPKEKVVYENARREAKEVKQEANTTKEPASQRIDLENKGIGPITSISLDEMIDDAMAAKGKEVFTAKCEACHKADKKFG